MMDDSTVQFPDAETSAKLRGKLTYITLPEIFVTIEPRQPNKYCDTGIRCRSFCNCSKLDQDKNLKPTIKKYKYFE